MDQLVRERQPAVAVEETHPLIIIGCGFGGIALAIELHKHSITDFVMLERGNDIGGVWRDNTYPGAACDIVSRFYSFSSDRNRDWSRPFAPQAEIWDYAQEIVARHGIRRHVRFNTEVAEAIFDDKTGLWTLTTAAGERYRTPVLVSAVGLFNRANIPNIPGRDSFKGVSFHSSNWNHAFPLEGKTVAVIGCGASAVQFLPEIAPRVAKLYSYQRSPQHVMPKAMMPGAGEWDAWLGKRKWLRGLARLKVHLMFERITLRRRRNPEMRLKGEEAFRALLERKVKDPELRKKLTPNYPMGCKRQLISDHWYEALTRPNVEVIVSPIEKITPDGVVSDGVERKVDAIIYGTGFTPTAYLTPMRVKGLAGLDLKQAWRDGAEAYLGITVAGFPNFFMMYGPNTNATTSIIFMLECQARYIVSAIRTLRRKRARFMTVRADQQRAFNAELQERLAATVWARPDCFSYTKDENGKVTTNWPGYSTDYLWRTRAVKPGDFEFVGSA
ncbi:MAG TPA: NAD(P)/FAD-dependent oxidoreductase [Xanthobacteraceae bacterium]|nr:NAD(P)/FAD-dependent oxidoreductase [Xanthobacteraceae bacterium]